MFSSTTFIRNTTQKLTNIKMKEETFVPITINGTQLQLGLTKKTTCGDVIKMVVNNDKSFTVYEIHVGEAKPLPRNTKLLKQVRTWGINRRDYSFEVKKIAERRKSKMASLLPAKEAFARLRSLLVKPNDIKEIKKSDATILNNLEENMRDVVDKQCEKNITILRDDVRADTNTERPLLVGKMELMSRYLLDTHNISITSSVEDINLDNTRDNNDTEMTGSRSFGSNLDIAFLTNSSNTENPTELADELNNCILYDVIDDTLTDDESAFEDMSECSSVCDFERNITIEEIDDTLMKINELKSAFSNGDLNARIIEDSMLESFMNTVVIDDESDEGLSSVGSDFE